MNVTARALVFLVVATLAVLHAHAAAPLQHPKTQTTTTTTAHAIRNVPYHAQINSFTCGDASLQMLFHHYRFLLNQQTIVNVARTSFEKGTLSQDIVRAGHFSNLSSSATSRLYPKHASQAGWSAHQPLGMAAFAHRQKTCWIDGLKSILAQNLPVIVLQYYSPDPSDGTHYRLVTGFDSEHIVLLDPWDREEGRVKIYSNDEFCNLWSYAEVMFNNETQDPFFGALITPWKIDVSFEALNDTFGGGHAFPYIYSNRFTPPIYINVTASISYPCPPPFCPNNVSTDVAKNVVSAIDLPRLMEVYKTPQTLNLGHMSPGDVRSVSWIVAVHDNMIVDTEDKEKQRDRERENVLSNDEFLIKVTAFGQISGAVPPTFCCGKNTTYPSYSYVDNIGGVGFVHY